MPPVRRKHPRRVGLAHCFFQSPLLRLHEGGLYLGSSSRESPSAFLTFFHPAGVHEVTCLPPNGELNREFPMKDERELVLKATKEIVVKFIEVGRLSVSSFAETWQHIYSTIQGSLEKAPKPTNDDHQ